MKIRVKQLNYNKSINILKDFLSEGSNDTKFYTQQLNGMFKEIFIVFEEYCNKQVRTFLTREGYDKDITINFWDHRGWKWVDEDKLIESVHPIRQELTHIFLDKFKITTNH